MEKCLNKISNYKKKYENIVFIFWDTENGVSVLWTPPKSKKDFNIVDYMTIIQDEDFFMDNHGRIWIYEKK
jgi:hypothetical protein